jgi:thiol-disulfide isomerase/thioredoxin
MKLNIGDRWKRYVARKSRWALLSDFAFLVVMLLLVFPPTRLWLVSNVSRLALFSPREIEDVFFVSDEAYNFKLVDVKTGDTLNMETGKGRVLMINFWATWCPPCVAEMPSMQRLYNLYGQKAMFVLISNESPSTVMKFLEKHGYTFPVYKPVGNISADFSWKALPTTYIVSKEGRLAVRKVGSARWDTRKMKRLMDGLLGE